MNVSPLDLRQQRFRKAFRGFDPVEVASFLAAVADDYEQALRETDRLKHDLMRMEAVLSEHREHEKNQSQSRQHVSPCLEFCIQMHANPSGSR